MVHFKEFNRSKESFLCIVANEDDAPKSGTILKIEKSLRRPDGIRPAVTQQNLLTEMATRVDILPSDGPSMYTLNSTRNEHHESPKQFPLLGRRIISNSDSVVWGANLRVPGEATFIPGYWEWAEDVLSRSSAVLEACSFDSAVYASLYSYDRDPNIFPVFCEAWCPMTNTLHTLAGELSISLWDIHKLGGLPISGDIYDEIVPNHCFIDRRDHENRRVLSKACDALFAAYHYLAKQSESSAGAVTAQQWINFWCKPPIVYKAPNKKRRNRDTAPKETQNPNGEIESQDIVWTKEECATFDLVEIVGDVKRETTYVAALLSCWLCVFAVPHGEDRLIRPGTFETVTLMARGEKFSLAVPVLASIYRGLNHIVTNKTPAYSRTYFPAHYVYGWLAFYFDTHHGLDFPPPSPLTTTYSNAQGSKYFEDVEARDLIHDGYKANVGCMILNKNRNDMLYEDGNLEVPKFEYLVSMRSAFLPIHSHGSFILESYAPHRFCRQFGFYQDLVGFLGHGIEDRKGTFYEGLRHWRLLLYKGSHSQLYTPCQPLNWHNLTTPRFEKWWPTKTIKDLRNNIKYLCLSVQPMSSRSKRDKGCEARDNRMSESGTSPFESTTGDKQDLPPPPKKTRTMHIDKVATSPDTSEITSDVDFKHQRRKKKEIEVYDLEGDEDGFEKALDNIPIPSNIPRDLSLVGDIGFEIGSSFKVDDAMIEDANRLPTIPQGKATPGKGKGIRIGKTLFQMNNSSSSIHGHPLIEATAMTFGNQLEAEWVPNAPTQGVAVPATLMPLTRVSPSPSPVFTKALSTLGYGYLAELK